MTSSFDTPIDRGGTGCAKWSRYADDVLPMWVADMDFASPPAILEALRKRVSHGVMGYAQPRPELVTAVRDYLARTYGWMVAPEAIVFVPRVVPGFNMALGGVLEPGDAVAIEVPVYPPILAAPGHWDLRRLDVDLMPGPAGWTSDTARLESALAEAAAVLLCNPQNPTGRVYGRAELARIADVCLTNDTLIVSDEIHCDLVLDGNRHTPIATLGPEVGARTITLMAASKTYNVAGLKTAFAVIESPRLRQRFESARRGLVDSLNVFGLEATRVAYDGSCADWHRDLLGYLTANRDHLLARLAAEAPEIVVRRPASLFLAWLDCSALGLVSPYRFFLEEGKIGFNDGADFGTGYGQFVRLNFGCPRALLDEGVDRIAGAIRRRRAA